MTSIIYKCKQEDNNMKVIVTKDYEEASQKAAEIMLDVIKNKPNANLGLATGSTPVSYTHLTLPTIA
mgnify:CR=1 FL=1